MEQIKGNEQIKGTNIFEDKLKQGLSPILNENGMDFNEDIINNLNNFQIKFNNNIYNGKEGFSQVIEVLNNNTINDVNLLDLMIFSIQETGYIDIDDLTGYLHEYLQKGLLNKQDNEIKKTNENINENINDNKSILKNIYNNFNITKLNSFHEYLNDAKKEVDIYLKKHPNELNNKDELIYSYILIKNKKAIINEYKSNISNNNGEYTQKGLEELGKSINDVEQNINNNYVAFSSYINENSNLNNKLDNSNLSKTLKSKIKNSFGGSDKNENIIIKGNEITIDNKRIILKNGKIEAELFKKDFTIPLNIDYPLELSIDYLKIQEIKKESMLLNKQKISYQSKIELRTLEINDYINEGFGNINIDKMKTLIMEYKGQIDVINEEIINLNKQYERILEEIRRKELINKQKVKLESERVNNVMEFLDEIGFTMIPQSMTNKLIQQLNGHRGLASQLGFNSEINFSKGQLGIEKDMDINNISMPEKKAFARFFNIFISGEENNPINLKSIEKGYNPIGDRNKFNILLQSKGMLNGNLSLGKGFQNIENFKGITKNKLNKMKL